MEEDARTWALPNLEELGQGKYPLNGKWTDFETAFKAWFMPQDAQELAQEAMKNLKQGKHTMVEYMSQFNQYTMQTGWSDKDHHTHFYDGLSEKIKDAMAITARPIGTLQELREHTVILDQRIRKRDAEKKGQTFSYNTTTTTQDPNAMEVDASRPGNSPQEKHTRNFYLQFMKGKCFGCGSTQHTKKDGNHEHDICNHCGKTGHRSPVCFNKYMGKPATAAKAAADTTSSTSTPNGPSTSSTATASATTNASAQGSKKQADLLAQLMKRLEEQQEEIKALKASF